MILRLIANWLESNSHGTVGTNLYAKEMPAEPANALMIVERLSPAPDQYLNTKTLDMDVWSRNKSSKTGYQELEELEAFMHRYHHVTLGDYSIYFIGAMSHIEYMEKDIEGRALHRQSYRVIYIDKRTVS